MPRFVALSGPCFVAVSISGPPTGGPLIGIMTVMAFAPHPLSPAPAAKLTDLIPVGFGEGHIVVGGLPTDGLLPLYRKSFVVGGAEPLPIVKQSSRGPCAASKNVFCSSLFLGGNGSPTTLERMSISLCALASQFQVVADFANTSNVS